MIRNAVLLLFLALPVAAGETKRVTLLHFSDYHSHALPFHTEEGMRGGIARAIGFMQQHARRGALVFSGGDMINIGAPAWSDAYQCIEWPWMNGIVDAMAFGNHEPDYGKEAFDRCARAARFPILAANVPGLEPYRVFERDGLRIGVFAVAGPDFAKLVKVPGYTFADPVAAARETVRRLREEERADAVVMIGHQHTEADYELARSVPGIDLIFGTHSHLKRELVRIPGTETWFISPGQYLTYISRVELIFAGGKLGAIDGALVPVDDRMPEDPRIARRVARLQRELEADPEHRHLFVPIGTLDTPLSVDALATLTLDAMRSATDAEVALSTMSSFRRPLPSGSLTLEALRGAMPYDNEIIVCSMAGDRLARLLDTVTETYVAGPAAIDPTRTYRVATTDYLANVAWKDAFVCEREKPGLRVRDEVRKRLATSRDTPAAAHDGSHSHPLSRAMREASTRFAAPSLLMASER